MKRLLQCRRTQATPAQVILIDRLLANIGLADSMTNIRLFGRVGNAIARSEVTSLAELGCRIRGLTIVDEAVRSAVHMQEAQASSPVPKTTKQSPWRRRYRGEDDPMST